MSAPMVRQLATNWMATWQRPPQPAEMDGLIRDYIKEEIYYREAKRLGLDVDDIVVRRRLRSKMEFLALSALENTPPTDAQLQGWLDKNPAKFARDQILSFDQVYISTQGGTDTALARANAIAKDLQTGKSPLDLSDPISLPKNLEATPSQSIANQFGQEFVDAIIKQPIGTWGQIVESGFGFHIVRLRALDAQQKPALSEVRQDVENDWRAVTLQQREAAAYQELLNSYDVKIESPK